MTKNLKHRFLSVFLVLCLAITPAFLITSSAETVELDSGNMDDQYLTYTLNSDTSTATVTSYDQNTFRSTVVIPEQVKKDGKTYAVTSIGSSAFETCYIVTSITIPHGVTDIGEYAFMFCENLEEVNLPDTLVSVKEAAFYGCSNLKSIQIPSGVISIGKFVFSYCLNLNSISVDSDNSYYSSDEYGVLYNKDKTKLIQYPTNCKRDTYIIPASVSSFSESALQECNNLTEIKVEEGNKCFSSDESNVLFNYDKTVLMKYPIGNTRTQYVVPNKVNTIIDHAFTGCSHLEDITIPDSVYIIGYNAFEGTSWYVNQPDGLVYAGKVAYFYKTTQNTETTIDIREGTLGISPYAFASCYGVKKISMPESVMYIPSTAFIVQTLDEITVDENNNFFTTDEFGVLYNKEKTILMFAPQKVNKNEFKIPDSVTRIDDYSLSGLYEVKNIVIPSTVKEIGLSSLTCKKVTILAKDVIFSENAINSNTIVFGRKGSSVEAYCVENENIFIDYIEQLNEDIDEIELEKLVVYDDDSIFELKYLYDILSETEKQEVANLSKLNQAVDKIEKLIAFPKYKDSFLDNSLGLVASVGVLPKEVIIDTAVTEPNEEQQKEIFKTCGDETALITSFNLSFKNENGEAIAPDSNYGATTATLMITDTYATDTTLVMIHMDGDNKITELHTEIKDGSAIFTIQASGFYSLVKKSGEIGNKDLYLKIFLIIAFLLIAIGVFFGIKIKSVSKVIKVIVLLALVAILLFTSIMLGFWRSEETEKSEAISDCSATASADMSTEDNSVMNAALSKYDINNDGFITVFFIGNSYTYSGNLPAQFNKAAQTQGLELRVYQKAEPGYSLYQSLQELPIDDNTYIEESDIVILQDYGGYIPDGMGYENLQSTCKVVPEIQALFDENVLFYFYPFLTQSATYNAEKDKYSNIEFIDTGELLNEIQLEYESQYFLTENFHNNDFCSYIFACLLYCTIFDADCTDIPYTKRFLSDLPGVEKEEKEHHLKKIKEYIMEFVNE